MLQALGPAKAVQTPDSAVVFLTDRAATQVDIAVPGDARRLLVVGLPPRAELSAGTQAGVRRAQASAAGVALIALGGNDQGTMQLRW